MTSSNDEDQKTLSIRREDKEKSNANEARVKKDELWKSLLRPFRHFL